MKILFTRAHALCHHFNTHTASKDNMDMCVGYSSGDVLWYETAVGRYTRLNKNVGCLVTSEGVRSLTRLPRAW